MTETMGKVTIQQNPRPPSNETRKLSERVLSETTKRRKPTGPITYTIEKGANVGPWQSKS